MRDFEIGCARLYVQGGLSSAQIAERLGCRYDRVSKALKECGLAVDGRRRTWSI
jgi:hypothetical protein